MKRIYLVHLLVLTVGQSYAQNTFPSSGNVGIGTGSPGNTLELVNSDVGDYKNSFLIRSNNPNVHWPLTIHTNGLNNWSGFFSNNNDLRLYLRNDSGQLNALINSDGNSYLNGGNVGIGTSNPTAPLHVVGHLKTTDRINAQQYIAVDKAGSYRVAMNGQSDGYIAGRNDQVQTKFYITSNGTSYFNGGEVGIGTTNPDSKLTVNGDIHAKEVKVDLNVPGPDYVFEQDYNLPTLESIQHYIKENKHLPEVPSAKEMEENGIDLGTMNMLLLKKVEELTLHLIEQNEKVERLEKEIQNIKSANHEN